MTRIIAIVVALALAVPLAVPALAETYTIRVPVASDGPSTWTPEPTRVTTPVTTPTPDVTVSAQPVGTLAPLPVFYGTPEGPDGRFSRPQMTALLADAGWPSWAIPDALAVTWCESRWQRWAVNPESGATGLFQLMPLHHPVMWARGLDPWAPLDNAIYSLSLFSGSGWTWQHWSCKPWMASPPGW